MMKKRMKINKKKLKKTKRIKMELKIKSIIFAKMIACRIISISASRSENSIWKIRNRLIF